MSRALRVVPAAARPVAAERHGRVDHWGFVRRCARGNDALAGLRGKAKFWPSGEFILYE
jgi:hypothetical protein